MVISNVSAGISYKRCLPLRKGRQLLFLAIVNFLERITTGVSIIRVVLVHCE